MDYRAPRGNITTVLDYVERDAQDDAFFPYTCTTSWFAPDGTPRSIPFTPALQTFSYRGPAGFGQKIVIDVNTQYGDMLHNIAIQLHLESWIPPHYLRQLLSGDLAWKNPDGAWKWADMLGNCLIERASFEVDEIIIEEIDSIFSHIALTAWPDRNMSASLLPSIEASDDCKVTCLLPFWFSRIPFKEAFPLIACKDGSVRINVTFRKFEDVVERLGAICGETPLGSSDVAVATGAGSWASPGTEHVIEFIKTQPGFKDISILSYSSYLGAGLREQYLRRPFEILVRQNQRFIVESDSRARSIMLPFNGPIEELLWVVRTRHGGNKLFEFANVVTSASIVINGSSIINMPGKWFRARAAGAHKGGIEIYNKYIYGYNFAAAPGDHQPSGSINFSRANSVELRLQVDSDDWEVHIYGIGINWLRFENGICGRIFGS